MSSISVKGYNRKSKSGKTFAVKGHTRNYVMRSQYYESRAKDQKFSRVSAGDELRDKKNSLNRDQVLAAEATLGYDRLHDYGDGTTNGKEKGRRVKEERPTMPLPKKKIRSFSSLEDRIASFVEKSGRQYKRKF